MTTEVAVRQTSGKRGYDTGLVKPLADSHGNVYGDFNAALKARVEADKVAQSNKQKLNACLKKKAHKPVSLVNGKTERWVRNEIGAAINVLVKELSAMPQPPAGGVREAECG